MLVTLLEFGRRNILWALTLLASAGAILLDLYYDVKFKGFNWQIVEPLVMLLAVLYSATRNSLSRWLLNLLAAFEGLSAVLIAVVVFSSGSRWHSLPWQTWYSIASSALFVAWAIQLNIQFYASLRRQAGPQAEPGDHV